MKVILLKDIPALGRKNDIKEVSGGYARNFLLPQKLAVPATDAAANVLRMQHAREEQEKSEANAVHRALADALKTKIFRFKVKTGGKGKTFGSVTATHIRDELNRQGIQVKKEWILLDGPIKSTGEKKMHIQFPEGIKAEISIIVEAE